MALRSTSTLEGRVFLSGFPSPRFEIRVFHSLRRAANQGYESRRPRAKLVLRRQPLAFVPPESVIKRPRDVNASGWNLTNRGCDETQALRGHFVEIRSSGWLGYRDEFRCLFIWERSARSTGMKFKKQNQNGKT